MPKQSRVTITPPTIHQRAQEEERVKMEDAETFRVKVNEEQKAKTLPDEWHLRPITTLHLTRHGDIITDSAYTVRIPAPASVKDGERVAVAIYRTKGDKWEIGGEE